MKLFVNSFFALIVVLNIVEMEGVSSVSSLSCHQMKDQAACRVLEHQGCRWSGDSSGKQVSSSILAYRSQWLISIVFEDPYQGRRRSWWELPEWYIRPAGKCRPGGNENGSSRGNQNPGGIWRPGGKWRPGGSGNGSPGGNQNPWGRWRPRNPEGRNQGNCNELENLIVAERTSGYGGGHNLICDSSLRSVAEQHVQNQLDHGFFETFVWPWTFTIYLLLNNDKILLNF